MEQPWQVFKKKLKIRHGNTQHVHTRAVTGGLNGVFEGYIPIQGHTDWHFKPGSAIDSCSAQQCNNTELTDSKTGRPLRARWTTFSLVVPTIVVWYCDKPEFSKPIRPFNFSCNCCSNYAIYATMCSFSLCLGEKPMHKENFSFCAVELKPYSWIHSLR